ncbi:BgTH12-04839 [Blumeria graminis f. sp. triticale]|uniref:Bgt-4858 n=3 Tax=Blumeria graminis TaxID=34373 RepID=A0A061HEC0_BLUGR|nr:hypothetical protein BGT96224_4858 [Blumeria graminis f. sp. tritici 96224]CAD6499187.1 BgTH12-04839 [Blumeria graminis f. sp. triticale]VCU39304.1 Bgt-4858 [Blumeria graminis f. sp. tritici]
MEEKPRSESSAKSEKFGYKSLESQIQHHSGLLSEYDVSWIYKNRPESDMIHVSQVVGAARTGEFSWRAPSPPHIHIPQISEEYAPRLSTLSGTIHNEEPYKGVLEAISRNIILFQPVREWKYEWRRQAQQILPFLYLGPSAAARNVEFLRQEGITMLLAIRDNSTAQAQLLNGAKVAESLGIKSASVDVAGHMGLIAAFPVAVKRINEHVTSLYRESQHTRAGKVLVSCESGNERSAAVVIAYMMNTYGLEMVAAIQYVQSQRFCVSFDDNLKHLLFSYMGILTAQKDVMFVNSQNLIQSTDRMTPVKRQRYEIADDNGEINMGIDNDEERFLSRASLYPFQ